MIYRETCASCHGPKGEGTLEEYPHPLIGERPRLRRAAIVLITADRGFAGAYNSAAIKQGEQLAALDLEIAQDLAGIAARRGQPAGGA